MIAGLVIGVMLLLGAPIFAVIAAGALMGFHAVEVDLTVIPVDIYRLAEMPILLAIPLFTFAGYLLGESKAPHRIMRVSEALLGWFPGGLAVVTLITCALFTAFTGASGVTIVALGALFYPALQEGGYADKFSLGLVTTSGSLGLLFAPSLPLILYGVVAQQLDTGHPVGIDQLFLAGILPGLLMLVLLAGWAARAPRDPAKMHSGFRPKEALKVLREAMWEAPLPLVVLGGIYSGYFAVSEAAAVTAVYVIVVEVFILREVPFRKLPDIMIQSMTLVGGILLILGVSMASTNYMIEAEVPSKLFAFAREHVSDRFTFLVLLNLFLLVLGAILDIFSALVLVVPLILPVALGYDIHPIHLGIIFLANMQIGYLTPPVGLNLFIASYRFKRPILDIYASTLPFFLLLILSVIIITYWPGLSLWLAG